MENFDYDSKKDEIIASLRKAHDKGVVAIKDADSLEDFLDLFKFHNKVIYESCYENMIPENGFKNMMKEIEGQTAFLFSASLSVALDKITLSDEDFEILKHNLLKEFTQRYTSLAKRITFTFRAAKIVEQELKSAFQEGAEK